MSLADPVEEEGEAGERTGATTHPAPRANPQASTGLATSSDHAPAGLEGLEALEQEIIDLLNVPSSPFDAGPRPAMPTGPATAGRAPPTPEQVEASLRSDILKLSEALESIRRDIAEHRSAVAGVHGQLVQVHSVLRDLRSAGDRPAPSPPGRAAQPPEPAPRSRPLSAAPIFFLGPHGEKVEAQAFFTLGKGGALESFLTRVLRQWEDSGYALETKGGAEGFSVKLVGDPEGRSLQLLPSGMYLMHLGEQEIASLRQLPPLVSSKVAFPRSGGFMAR